MLLSMGATEIEKGPEVHLNMQSTAEASGILSSMKRPKALHDLRKQVSEKLSVRMLRNGDLGSSERSCLEKSGSSVKESVSNRH
jgi:hypothetical protein